MAIAAGSHLAVLAGAALLVRCLVVVLTADDHELVNDAADFSRLAASIAAGEGYGSSLLPAGGPTALRPPGFPFLLGGIYAIAGVEPTVARLVGAALGAVSVVLVAVLIEQATGDRRHALAGGALAALFPPMVLASTAVMSEALFVPLVLGIVTTAMAYRRSGHARWLLACGLLGGLATVTRPVGALLAVPVLLIVLGRRPWPRGWRRAVAGATALAAVPCLAWEARNIIVLDAVVPLTTQSGYLLAGTYNATAAARPDAPGAWILPTLDPTIARLVAANPQAGEVELGELLGDAAIDYLQDNPSYLLTVVANNTLRLFDLTSPAFARDVVRGEYGYGPTAATAAQLSAIAVLALAVLGLLRGAARRWPRGVWLVPVLLVVATVPVQSFSRFRAPIDPFLVIAAAAVGVPRRPAPAASCGQGGSASPQPSPAERIGRPLRGPTLGSAVRAGSSACPTPPAP